MPKPDKGDVTEYHIHLHQGQDDAAIAAITNLANLVQSAMPTMIESVNQLREQVQSLETQMATDLSRITSEVAETRTVIDGAIALIQGLAEALRNAASSEDVTAEVNALADSLESAQADLAAAIDNVPHPDNTLPS